MTTIKPKLGIHACSRAIKHWGEDRQRDMVVEELAELQKALMKYRRYGKAEEWREKCVEEAADVSIMLEQLIEMISSEKEFETVRAYKLKRLNNLIDCDEGLQTCENDNYERCVV